MPVAAGEVLLPEFLLQITSTQKLLLLYKMNRNALINSGLIVSIVSVFLIPFTGYCADVLWSENFESPSAFDDWSVDNGVWEVGVPTSGPSGAHEGTNCAATVLDGDYSRNVGTTRLISPMFTVPAAEENPRLRFWHWYSFDADDSAKVYIRASGGDWEQVSGLLYSRTSSGIWSRASEDLSAWAGQDVQIAFVLGTNTSYGGGTTGWYIDEVHVECDILSQMDDFIDDESIDELVPFSVTAESSTSGLTFSLAAGAPDGMTIDPVSGQIDWTPQENQGPNDYLVTVWVTHPDNSLLPIDAETFEVEVWETNSAPMLDPIADVELDEHETVTFTAVGTDPDNVLNVFGFIHKARFNDLTLNGWSNYNRSSGADWEPAEYGERYAQAFGFNTGGPSDAWLISPVIDLTNTDDEVLIFDSLTQFSGPAVEVFVSTDYSGSGDPEAANWTMLDPTLPSEENVWTSSGDIDLSQWNGQNIYLAFQYTSDGPANGQSALWQIDNIKVKGILPPVFQTLTYSLDPGAPSGAEINPMTGEFTWTPSEYQGPLDHDIVVRVTDDGIRPPNLSGTESVTVTVNEVNRPPEITAVPSGSIDEEAPYSFAIQITDPDWPANELTLVREEPNADIGQIDGSFVFKWTPTEEQGPGEFDLAISVTDYSPMAVNEKSLGDDASFHLTVLDVNKAPILQPVAPVSIVPGESIQSIFVASDQDIPVQSIAFSLGAGAPPGASIEPVSGLFQWATSASEPFGMRTIEVIATDNGSNPSNLTDTESLSVMIVYIWDQAEAAEGYYSKHSDWYGYLNDDFFPVIDHEEHGVQYQFPVGLGEFYGYDFRLARWFYFSETMYPYVYMFGEPGTFLYFVEGTYSPYRWFWQPDTGFFQEE